MTAVQFNQFLRILTSLRIELAAIPKPSAWMVCGLTPRFFSRLL